MTTTPYPSANRFRFRAWDPKTKKMVEDTGVPHTAHRGSVDLTNHIYMQSIGRTDRNRKEIYEGDILRGYGTYPMEVVWGKYGWMLRFEDDCDGQVVCQPINDDFFREYDAEVIGNIYENLQLLPKA